MAAMETTLEQLLDDQKAAVLAFVANLKTTEANFGLGALDGSSETMVDADKASLLRRNTELAAILGHSQKTVNEQEIQIKELKLALSQAQHELAEVRLGVGSRERRPSLSNEANPFLGDGYIAAAAADVLDESENAAFDESALESLVLSNQDDNATEDGPCEGVSDGVDDASNEFEEEFDNPDAANITALLKRIHKSLLSSTGGGSREIGKAEFDILAQTAGLEDGKKLRSDLLSLAGKPPASGLSCSDFVRAFISKTMPLPGSSSIPSAVWQAVSATEMGLVLTDGQKRELLETELGRWWKGLQPEDEVDDVSSDEYDDDGDVEPWDLGEQHAAGTVVEMQSKYELRGPKQGEEDLGEGRAGVVRKCVLKNRSEGDEVIVRACKCISKKQQSLDETERELDIMKKLIGQPSVSQLLDIFEAPDRLFLVSELCEGGELYSQIIDRANEDESRPFSEREAAIIMKQVLTAVGMLHDNLIVHRDVKPENLLLRQADGSLEDLVLIDFGLSRFFEPGQRLTTRVGTVYYTAPEVWTERYDNKCDLFSCGVLLYVLLCLYTPFDGDDDNDILRKVMRGKFAFPDEEWAGVSDDAKDFIKKLMSKYPRRRPSALEALEHPWFASAMGDGGGEEMGAAAEAEIVVEDA